MRVVGLRLNDLPGVPPAEIELPRGLVALATPDGRVRRAILKLLTDPASDSVQLLPRVADPGLARLPDGLFHRLRTGRGLDDADATVEAATRALAWEVGLDRLEGARARLGRLRGRRDPRDERALPEALLDRIRELEGAPTQLAGLQAELRELRGDDVEVAGDLEQATMEWLRERQDAETHLQAYRDRARELRARIQEMAGAGEEADCPVCRRPLREHSDAVRAVLEEEWEDIVQDGSWWRRRREQLELKPDRLQELERKALRVHAATEALSERVERVRVVVQELEDLRSRLAGSLAAADPPQGSGEGEGRTPWDAVDRAFAVVARGLRTEARRRLLDRTSTFLNRISAGRILGATWSAQGHLVLQGMDGPLHPPAEEDAVAAEVAVRVAAMELLREDARGGIVLGDVVDRLDAGARVRAVDLLRERCGGALDQILLITRGEIIDLFPEGFDAVVEIRADGVGPMRLPAGVGVLRLTGMAGDAEAALPFAGRRRAR